jgi:hypothetical protein
MLRFNVASRDVCRIIILLSYQAEAAKDRLSPRIFSTICGCSRDLLYASDVELQYISIT